MFKFVVGDYKRQAWSGLKQIFHLGNWSIYVYMCIIPPIMFSLNDYQAYVYYSAFGPTLIGLLLSRMYPNRISKTLLLCPMTLEERKSYLVTGLKLKIAIPLLIFGVCNVPLIIMKKLMFVYFAAMFVFLILFTVSVNIYCDPAVNAQGAFDREYDLPGYYPVWEVAVQLVGIYGVAILTNIQMTQKDFFEDKLALVTAILLFSAELGLCIKMIRTYYKPIMEQAVCYDTSYGKEKKNEVDR